METLVRLKGVYTEDKESLGGSETSTKQAIGKRRASEPLTNKNTEARISL